MGMRICLRGCRRRYATGKTAGERRAATEGAGCGGICIGCFTLRDAGVENPEMYKEYTDKLVTMGLINRTKDGRYYVD